MANFNGGSGKDTIYGNNKTSDFGGRNDRMFGNEAADKLFGMSGNDDLFGGSGMDLLAGGKGNDDLFGDSGADRFIYESGNDTFDGGSEVDTLSFQAVGFVTTTFDMVASHFISGRATGIDLDLPAGQVDTIDGDSLGTISLRSVEKIELTGHNDRIVDSDAGRTITTFAGNDRIEARGGDDTIVAGAGKDFIDGGRGADDIFGGSGVDTLSFASWNDVAIPRSALSTVITLNDAGDSLMGTAVLSSTAFFTQSTAQVEKDFMTDVENVIGTKFSDKITGNAVANKIEGGVGNDTIAGLGGADSLNGGDGVDTLDYSASSSGVSMRLLVPFGQGGDAEGDVAIGFENISGSAFGDTLTGNSSVNTIRGGGGGDAIFGGAGNDVLDGGAGRDFLNGSSGSDKLTGGSGNDDFIFRRLIESTTDAFDTITDFEHGRDRIDLSSIDAVVSDTDNDSFHFVLSNPPPASAPGSPPVIPSVAGVGTLILQFAAIDTNFDQVNDHVLNTAFLHVDFNGIADAQINILTTISQGALQASDFLL